MKTDLHNYIGHDWGYAVCPCQHHRRAWLTEYEPDTGSWSEYYGCPDCGEELPRPLTIIDHLRRLWWKVETALGINTIQF